MNVVADHLGGLEPGELGRGVIPVGSLASGMPLGLPYLVARGASAHPCLWVNSNVHGNESQAAYTAISFIRRLDPAAMLGSVVVTPVSNPPAFDARRKHSPYDEIDLDQSFPGRATRLLTERIAETLFGEVACVADTLVNLHTMAHFLDAVPYAVYKVAEDVGVPEDALLKAASLFEPFVACRMDLHGGGELPGDIAGSLDYQVLKLGRPALMIELGAGGRLDLPHVEQGVEGLRRLLSMAGISSSPILPAPRPLTRVTHRTHVTCSQGGFFRAHVRPGSTLRAGEPLGDVLSVFGDLVEVVSLPHDSLVIGIRRDPVVHTGDRVGFVAVDWEMLEV